MNAKEKKKKKNSNKDLIVNKWKCKFKMKKSEYYLLLAQAKVLNFLYWCWLQFFDKSD